MNTKGQLLLVSGLLMSITLIAVSSTITHSVNLGTHQGERHDLTPHISSIESNFPLALEHQISQDDGSIPISESFDQVSGDFETLFAINKTRHKCESVVPSKSMEINDWKVFFRRRM